MDIHATPAYGRDYKSKAAVIKDWTEGKDFRCALTGKYLSVRDEIPGVQIWIRYNKLRNIIRVQ